MNETPSFNEISAIEERILLSKLEIARKLISHSPEKGRSLENEVAAVIRQMLPPEYGVGSGFIVFHGDDGPELSSQLDIIIYDAIKGGPLGRMSSCEVYPIESVYGYIEVKASIRVAGPKAKKLPKNSLQVCLKQNEILRRMKKRLYWSPNIGSPMKARPVEYDALSVRLQTNGTDVAII